MKKTSIMIQKSKTYIGIAENVMGLFNFVKFEALVEEFKKKK